MSATDTIRALLDERGVEYRTHGMTDRTWFDVGGISWFVIERENGSLAVQAVFLTPEQAVEVTLGHAYEPPLAAHWDGDTLTLTIPRDPSCIRVQRSAEQPCKVYADESKVIAATLGRGECRNKAIRPQTFWCDQCDCAAEGWVDVGGTLINGFRYCPNCGRKVRA